MPSVVNQEFVKEFTEEIKKSSHVLVTEYQGLTAEEFNELRAKLKTHGAKFKVMKNRLAKIILNNMGRSGLEASLKGPSALAYDGADIAAITKALFKFSEDHKNLKVKAGHAFGTSLDARSLKEIANLPSREVLLSTLLARLQSPLQTLVGTLNEPLRSMHGALAALAKKKESTPAA